MMLTSSSPWGPLQWFTQQQALFRRCFQDPACSCRANVIRLEGFAACLAWLTCSCRQAAADKHLQE